MKNKAFNKIKVFCVTILRTVCKYVSVVASLWHICLTVIILVGAFMYVAYFSFSLNASDWGSFLSGVSSSLAFIWLIKGMHIQSENLRLQRVALETQVKELSNNAKFSSLSQIENIITRANQIILESGLEISKPLEIFTLFMKGMTRWKKIIESSSPSVVSKEYEEWIKIEGIARQYLAFVSQALKIYLDHNTNVTYDRTTRDEDFFYIYSTWGNSVPFLSAHISPAAMVAQQLFICTPGLESMKVAGLYAATKTTGIMCFRDGYLDELKADLVSKGYCVPTIAKEPSEAN